MSAATTSPAQLPECREAGSGKPLVLIPGMEGAWQFWSQQLRALSDRYRVVACSYIVRRPRHDRRVADYADDFLRLMDHLGIDRAAVVAESMGGLIAQELVTAHPERVAALVLCNTMDRPRPIPMGFNLFTLATLAHPLAFVIPERHRRPLLTWVGRHRGFVMDPSPGNAALAEYLLAHGLDPGLGGYLDRMLAGLKARYTERLGSIRVPTLVFRGTEDRIVTERVIRGLAARIPGADLAFVEGGGHCCQVSCPEATNRVLRDWLDSVGY